MQTHLVVVRPFSGFARGDLITDPSRIAEILQSEHALNVVRVLAQSNPAPQGVNQPSAKG
ncbi:MAG: hypothetical protein JOY71_19725 [Acetobacteraceae bacterium]|nr:hypothetical protein [Acetobacteraceae bacterium]MBV8590753.1 hypothetical protein [Acetobacteraceae bacterium]